MAPLLVLADTAAALLRGWSFSSATPRLVVASCALSVLALAVLSLAPGLGPWLRRRGPDAILAAASLLLSAVAGEAALRLYPGLLSGAWAHSRGPDLRLLFRPDPSLVSGVSGESRYSTNAEGIRGASLPEPGRSHRVLCIGGSTTECTYLDNRETWPQLLMDELNARDPQTSVWVGSLGISGYSSVEHLDFVSRSPLPGRMQTLVFMLGVNDLLKALNGSLETGPRPLWRRLALVDAALAVHRRSTLRAQLTDLEDPRGESLVARRRARSGAEVPQPLPDLTRAVQEYAARIDALMTCCDRLGIHCVFVTQPVLWSDGLSAEARSWLWLGTAADGSFLPPAALRRGMDLYNDALKQVCRRRGVACVDLDEMSGREVFFSDDCHFTEAGAREVARRLAEALEGATARRSGGDRG